MSKQENKLLDSLRQTDFEVNKNLTNNKETITEPEKLNSSPTNFHPSLWEMHLYSSALISGLEKINCFRATSHTINPLHHKLSVRNEKVAFVIFPSDVCNFLGFGAFLAFDNSSLVPTNPDCGLALNGLLRRSIKAKAPKIDGLYLRG